MKRRFIQLLAVLIFSVSNVFGQHYSTEKIPFSATFIRNNLEEVGLNKKQWDGFYALCYQLKMDLQQLREESNITQEMIEKRDSVYEVMMKDERLKKDDYLDEMARRLALSEKQKDGFANTIALKRDFNKKVLALLSEEQKLKLQDVKRKKNKSDSVIKEKLLFSDDFEQAQLRKEWRIRERFRDGGFVVENGHLKGKELPGTNHGSVMRVDLNYSNIIVEFDVNFKGGERFNIVMDDTTNTSSYWGHISRVSFSKKGFQIKDDKTGGMDLKIWKQIQKNPERKKELDSFLKTKVSETKFRFEEGKWYHVKITKKGDLMQCEVDGVIGQLKSEGIAHPNLNIFGPTVRGDYILFDNIKVWEIKN